jgi:hypothetical protein
VEALDCAGARELPALERVDQRQLSSGGISAIDVLQLIDVPEQGRCAVVHACLSWKFLAQAVEPLLTPERTSVADVRSGSRRLKPADSIPAHPHPK